jgi:hypothetical protein
MLAILLFFVVVSSHAPQAYAQNPTPQPGIWPDQGTADSFEAAAKGDVNSTAHVANVNSSNYADLIRRIIGPVPGVTVTSMDSPLAKQMLAQSAVYNLSSYITALYLSPPASTYAFVQDMGQTLGVIPKTAYAQGVGFSGLSALLPVWKIFRNLAYFLLAIVMVVIGFMVMFRKKIDPKTVVTVQNALPSIVLSLLLITFSYAIVGICIDIMYLLIAIIGSIFKSSGLIPDISSQAVLSGDLWSSIFKTVPETQLLSRLLFGSTDSSLLKNIQVSSTITGLILATLGPAGVVAGLALIIGGGLSSLLVGALFSLGLFFLFVRLFIFFISTYIKIIIALVFSPFQLLLTAIPGNKAFETWFKNLIANILIFPAASVMFILANVFMNPPSNTPLWSPPYTVLFSSTTVGIGTVVSLGLLFAIPTVGKMIQDALKTKEGAGIGLGNIGGAFTGMTQTAQQSLSTLYYLKQWNPKKATQQVAPPGPKATKS